MQMKPMSGTFAALLFTAIPVFAAPPASQEKPVTTAATNPFAGEKPGRDDFNFLMGDWQTVQTRSTKPLEDGAPWETFDATLSVKKLPGNLGNIDSMLAPAWRPGWTGVTIRVFNGETGNWAIYWMAGKTGGIDSATGALATPVVGKFDKGIGIFECDEVLQGVPIRTQYKWTHVDADNVRWQQAFSFDGGKTWKVNWKMEGKRVR